jgi:transposase
MCLCSKLFTLFAVELMSTRSLMLQRWVRLKNRVLPSTKPVFNIFENDCDVVIANPKYVKGIRDKKTDKKDSIWLCDLHKHGLVPSSFIPPLLIRQIRDLMRYRFKLINFKSSEKNRIQNSFTVSSVVSDTFGVSSMKIIHHILENPDDKDFDVSALLHASMKDKTETIVKSINGNLTKP